MKAFLSVVLLFICLSNPAAAHIADSSVLPKEPDEFSNRVEYEVVLIMYHWSRTGQYTCGRFDYLVSISPDGRRSIAIYLLDQDAFAFAEFDTVTQKYVRLAVRTDYKWWVGNGEKKTEFINRLSESAYLLGYSGGQIATCLGL